MTEETVSISIISFNTLGVPVISKNLTERFVTLANLIDKKTDVDILAFQEVHTYVHLHLLRKILSKFKYVIYKKAIYGPKGGLVIFSKLPIEAHQYNRFSKNGAIKNRTFYARLVGNGTLVCKLRDYPIYVLNTYFTTNPNTTWKLNAAFYQLQETQIRDLARVISLIRNENEEVIVAGDFNFTKESPSYELFVSLTNAKNIFDKFSLPTYLFERRTLKFNLGIKLLDKLLIFNAKESGQVDYMFLIQNGKRVSVKKTEHIFDEKVKLFNGKSSYLSDHVGLQAKLEYKV